MSWPEIEEAVQKSKRDLRLFGDKCNKRVEDTNGELPAALFSLSLLTRLEISKLPALKTIPSDIIKLIQLKELLITENANLSHIPPEIGRLVDLKTLILESNAIEELPSEIARLKNLQVLNVSGNRLSSLPEQFSSLSELITLNLNRNKLTSIPKFLYKMPKLSTLSFAYNAIETVDDEIGLMAALQTLDLSSNQLKDVPAAIGNVPKLKDVKLEGNPYKDKKFAKMLDGGKGKGVVQHLKKIAPKPKKEEVPVKPKIYRIRIENPAEPQVVHVATAQTFRPYLLMAIFKDVAFSEQSFKEFIDMQTEIHQTVCKKRTQAAIGTHDLASVKGPFSYEAAPPSQIRFVPLKMDKSVNGLQLIDYFVQSGDATMSKYLNLIKSEPLWPVLYDHDDEVLSLPPVINSRYSQISMKTRDILVECSSSQSLDNCKEAMNALLDRFSKLILENSTAEYLRVEQVKVLSENGHLRVRYPTEKDIEEICKDDDDDE
eukprot:TRINITY_DN9291_c0_g1_i1.p1 TRINITY_DN9291_c0_g1~~TRINITY_DN9291_c0_g1_i1.p1  ORF type:complete len:488 (-),score=130.37 TRINITY_DN9291_c0_g1_i1:4-1467(-)